MTSGTRLASFAALLIQCTSPHVEGQERSGANDATTPAMHVPPAPRVKEQDGGTLVRSTMNGYVTSWGSPLRSSRVRVAGRRLEALEKTAQTEGAPQFLLVDDGSAHIVIDYGARADLRAHGKERIATIPKEEGSPIALLSDRLFAGEFEFLWSGARGQRAMAGLGGARDVFALALSTDYVTAVFQNEPNRGVRVPKVGAWCQRLLPGLSSERRWDELIEGRGSGAVGADRRVAIAMQDGRFVVLSADGEPAPAGYIVARKSTRLVDTKLSFSPYDISVVADGYALLARTDRSVSLHLLDATGAERWSVPVPFTPSEPPIDGNDGRIYLVGNGFAAYEAGRAVWSSLSTATQYATAYADGTVALAAGPELRIVGRDGSVKQTFRTAQGEPITTPPAIADDGSVWVATASALYVAR